MAELFTFYHETITNYIGGTKLGLPERERLYKTDFYNPNSDGCNKPMFLFMRENGILFEELNFVVIEELH